MTTRANVSQSVSVFFSYSHADEQLRDQLAQHLSILQRQNVIELWHQRRIAPGTERAREIAEHLEQADLILLLVSADFLASDYINGVEVQRALQRHEDPNDRARVIPVILRSVEWHGAPFGELQALPTDGKPIAGRDWHDRDEAFADVARGVHLAAEAIRRQREVPPPSAASRSTEAHVETGSERIAPSGKPVPALPPNPYRGLNAFLEEHASFFFGRDEATAELIERVLKSPLVAVVGASGSGKSSLVFAGLVPRIRSQQGWLIQDFRPGRNVFRALARAVLQLPPGHVTPSTSAVSGLARSMETGDTTLTDAIDDVLVLAGREDTRVLLVVDQFEELFTTSQSAAVLPWTTDHAKVGTLGSPFDPTPSPGEERHPADAAPTQGATDAPLRPDTSEQMQRAHGAVGSSHGFDPRPFLEQLLGATQHHASRLHLVLTLRADFLGSVLEYRHLADALNWRGAQYTLGPMTAEEVRAVIEEPARKQGVALEEGLSKRISKEVEGQPGSLPLLEFALTQLWNLQEDGVLTHRAYDAIGGVEQALARHADETYEKLTAAERAAAHKVFLNLVFPGAGQEDTRRLASREELADVWPLVRRLADRDARLLTVTGESEGQQTAEVIHEALIRKWGRLRGWMREHRTFREWQERLRQDVKVWMARDRAEDALLRGYPLDQARQQQAQYEGLLSEQERAFIAASEAMNRREQKAQRHRELDLEIASRKAESNQRTMVAFWFLSVSLFGFIALLGYFMSR